MGIRAAGDAGPYLSGVVDTLPTVGVAPPVCCVVVGDDTAAKVSMLHRFLAPTAPLGTALEVVVTRPQVGTPVLTVVPAVDAEFAQIRGEVYQGAQVVVITFSIRDRLSFEAVTSRWVPELERSTSHFNNRIPVVLVGVEAEARQLAGTDLVDSKEAVRCAQQIHAAKYVEIYSGNDGHVREMFLQALRVASPFNDALVHCGRVSIDACLQCPAPSGTFDTHRRGFQIDTHDTALRRVVLASVDGTDPRSSTSAFEIPDEGFVSPKLLDKVLGSKGLGPAARLLLSAKARGMYASPVVEVLLPQQLPAPAGYFSAITKCLILAAPQTPAPTAVDVGAYPQPTLRYTTDGTDPNVHSRAYYQPIRLDDSDALVGVGTRVAMTPYYIDRTSQASKAPPKEIRVAAFAEGYFPSAVVVFTPPPILPTPVVHYAPHTGTLTIDGPSPLFEYRYTLDGSTPSENSLLYTRPVIVSLNDAADGPVKEIRAAAFPRVFFPSAEVRVDVRSHSHNLRQGPHIISTTRSATARSTFAHRAAHLDDADVPADNQQPASYSATTKAVRRGPPQQTTPVRRPPPTNNTSPSSTSQPRLPSASRKLVERGSPSAQPHRDTASSRLRRAHPAAQSQPPTPKRTVTPTRSRVTGHKVTKNAAPTPMKATEAVIPSTPSAEPAAPTCSANDNEIVFDFPSPIDLSHITVSTPGGGQGPDSYEVLVLPASGGHAEPMSVGLGDLSDERAIQTMHVVNSARAMPLTRVICKMFGPRGFEVLDMKVHGRPAAAATPTL